MKNGKESMVEIRNIAWEAYTTEETSDLKYVQDWPNMIAEQ